MARKTIKLEELIKKEPPKAFRPVMAGKPCKGGNKKNPRKK